MARECPVSCGKCQGTIGVGPGGGIGVVAPEPVVVGPGTGIGMSTDTLVQWHVLPILGVVACSDKGTDCPKVPHLCNNNVSYTIFPLLSPIKVGPTNVQTL